MQKPISPELATWQGVMQRELIDRFDRGIYTCSPVWAKRRNHLLVNTYINRTFCGARGPVGVIGDIDTLCESCTALYRETFLMWLTQAADMPQFEQRIGLIQFTVNQYPSTWHFHFING